MQSSSSGQSRSNRGRSSSGRTIGIEIDPSYSRFVLILDGLIHGPFRLAGSTDPTGTIRAAVRAILNEPIHGLIFGDGLALGERTGTLEVIDERPLCADCGAPIEDQQPFVAIEGRPGAYGHAGCSLPVPEGVPPSVTITAEDRVGPFKCDFCSETNPTWRYPCGSFDLAELGVGSPDDWLACERCAKLIEAADRPALRARTLASNGHPEYGPLARQTETHTIRSLHDAFFAHRSGPRQPFG